MNIRPETTADPDAIRQVHRLAFDRYDEARLVDSLRDGGFFHLSLVAEIRELIVGHILFSDLPIVSAGKTIRAVSLAPLAVLPENQGRGIGSALIRAGLDACRRQGHQIVIVLGSPRFYTRFGFSAERAAPLESPFSGEYWMATELLPGALDGVSGTVQYPPPFFDTKW